MLTFSFLFSRFGCPNLSNNNLNDYALVGVHLAVASQDGTVTIGNDKIPVKKGLSVSVKQINLGPVVLSGAIEISNASVEMKGDLVTKNHDFGLGGKVKLDEVYGGLTWTSDSCSFYVGAKLTANGITVDAELYYKGSNWVVLGTFTDGAEPLGKMLPSLASVPIIGDLVLDEAFVIGSTSANVGQMSTVFPGKGLPAVDIQQGLTLGAEIDIPHEISQLGMKGGKLVFTVTIGDQFLVEIIFPSSMGISIPQVNFFVVKILILNSFW